jgi:transposase-like protein
MAALQVAWSLPMRKTSYAGHQFPYGVIQRAVWLYLRFALRYWAVEDPLAERCFDVSYEISRDRPKRVGYRSTSR